MLRRRLIGRTYLLRQCEKGETTEGCANESISGHSATAFLIQTSTYFEAFPVARVFRARQSRHTFPALVMPGRRLKLSGLPATSERFRQTGGTANLIGRQA